MEPGTDKSGHSDEGNTFFLPKIEMTGDSDANPL
ncbi:MAG: hypothetical protein RLY31_595 [Bacteroidota bacterium]|jgi:hypothetical protein